MGDLPGGLLALPHPCRGSSGLTVTPLEGVHQRPQSSCLAERKAKQYPELCGAPMTISLYQALCPRPLPSLGAGRSIPIAGNPPSPWQTFRRRLLQLGRGQLFRTAQSEVSHRGATDPSCSSFLGVASNTRLRKPTLRLVNPAPSQSTIQSGPSTRGAD